MMLTPYTMGSIEGRNGDKSQNRSAPLQWPSARNGLLVVISFPRIRGQPADTLEVAHKQGRLTQHITSQQAFALNCY